MAENLTEAQLAAVEARTDTKFERLLGEFRASSIETNARIDALAATVANLNATVTDVRREVADVRREVASDRNWVIGTVVGVAVAVAALNYSALGYGAAQFYNGSVIRDLVHKEAQSTAPATPARDARRSTSD
jgi:hypothetical protein